MLYSGEVLDFGQGVTDATQYDELFDSLMLAQHNVTPSKSVSSSQPASN